MLVRRRPRFGVAKRLRGCYGFPMSYLPINVDVRGRPCLVVGGGEVGRRKVEGLLARGARVLLVSRELTAELQTLADRGRLEYLGPDYDPRRLDGAVLVYAATDDRDLNERVSRDAQSRGLWVNVADRPDLCTFIVPSSITRGDLTVSVSTNGRSPALAAHIRSRLENMFGPEYGVFLTVMGRVRERVLASSEDSRKNRKIFTALVASPLLDLLARGDRQGANRILEKHLGPGCTLEDLGVDPDQGAPS